MDKHDERFLKVGGKRKELDNINNNTKNKIRI
jgi:hypothetical protein